MASCQCPPSPVRCSPRARELTTQHAPSVAGGGGGDSLTIACSAQKAAVAPLRRTRDEPRTQRWRYKRTRVRDLSDNAKAIAMRHP